MANRPLTFCRNLQALDSVEDEFSWLWSCSHLIYTVSLCENQPSKSNSYFILFFLCVNIYFHVDGCARRLAANANFECRLDTASHRARWDSVRRDIHLTGTYDLTETELTFGAKLAWRNSARCIGRIQWAKLQVSLYPPLVVWFQNFSRHQCRLNISSVGLARIFFTIQFPPPFACLHNDKTFFHWIRWINLLTTRR